MHCILGNTQLLLILLAVLVTFPLHVSSTKQWAPWVWAQPNLSQSLTLQGPDQGIAWGCPLGPVPGTECSPVKPPSPAPVSILTPDSVPTPHPSPEGSCSVRAWPLPAHSRAVPNSKRRDSVFHLTSHIRSDVPCPRNSKAQGALERALDLVRGALCSSPGSADEQLCDFEQVALPCSALLSTSVQWESSKPCPFMRLPNAPLRKPETGCFVNRGGVKKCKAQLP